MTYRTDKSTSGPQGGGQGGKMPSAQSPSSPGGVAADVNHNVHVYNHMNNQQSANVPVPGSYRPAHPQQNGKG